VYIVEPVIAIGYDELIALIALEAEVAKEALIALRT
jgi:hypothetical protein